MMDHWSACETFVWMIQAQLCIHTVFFWVFSSFTEIHGDFIDCCFFSCHWKPLLYSSGEWPPSNMAPSVLKCKSRTLVIGGSGGSMITPAVASVNIKCHQDKLIQTDAPLCYSLHHNQERLHPNPSYNHHFVISKIDIYFSISLQGDHEPPFVWKEP